MNENVDFKRLGQRLRDFRTSKGMTQKYLADKVGCTSAYLSNIENGHTKVSIKVLFSVARELNTTIDNLLERESSNYSITIEDEMLKILSGLSDEMKERLLKIANFMKV